MSITSTQILQIANLAKLSLTSEELPAVTERLNHIFILLDNLKQIDTENIQPLTNPLEATQRLRNDTAQTNNLRDYYQSLTPHIDEGLYLVPQVI